MGEEGIEIVTGDGTVWAVHCPCGRHVKGFEQAHDARPIGQVDPPPVVLVPPAPEVHIHFEGPTG